MTDHLSVTTINALADGELSADQLALVNEHLVVCSPCTSTTLAQTLLKTNLAKAGQRYEAPPGLQGRLRDLAFREAAQAKTPSSVRPPARRYGFTGWAGRRFCW